MYVRVWLRNVRVRIGLGSRMEKKRNDAHCSRVRARVKF